MYYITIKDSDGVLRPEKLIYCDDDNLKYVQPEIDKFMIKGKKEGFILVKVELLEVNQ